MIDCLLIGHNTVAPRRARAMLSFLTGADSHEVRDRRKYSLSQVDVGGDALSPVQLYNQVHGLGPEAELDIIGESFSLAIACLGSRLREAGLSFEFVNAFQPEKQRVRELLESGAVRTVAIITTYYLSPYPISEIVKLVRRCAPAAKVIVGGPYVLNNFDAGLLTDEQSKLLELIDADYYVRDSFGEDLLVELVRAVEAGSGCAHVENLYYRSGTRYRSTQRKVQAYTFPPVDWPAFAGRLGHMVNFRTAVSCPFSCAFCNFPFFAGKYKVASLEWCETQLGQLADLGVTHLQFVDDTFNLPKRRFKELLKMMIANGFGFRWSSFFKCQYVDPEVIELMVESGCEYVFLGIESGSQTILDNMNKRADVGVYAANLELLREHDIMTMCSLIVGFPGETAATFEETYEFVERTRPTFYQQRLWWYDRHAPIHDQAGRYAVEGQGYDWSHATMSSDQAHDLADRLFLDVQNSIHITENALPFLLLGRGMGRRAVFRYLESYMHANREAYVSGGGCRAEHVTTMRDALGPRPLLDRATMAAGAEAEELS